MDTASIDVGETSKDMMWTISDVECFDACLNAPIIQVNDDHYEKLTVKDTAETLNDLKNGNKPPAPGPRRRTSGPQIWREIRHSQTMKK